VGDPSLPFGKDSQFYGDEKWLRAALAKIEERYVSLGIDVSDFDQNDAWEPLPLDRSDPLVTNTIERLDEAVQLVRSDNGYPTHAPEEREMVLADLSQTQNKFEKSERISVAFLKRYAVEPLNKLIRRFGGAAIGLAAMAARQAIQDYLKKRFGIALDEWIGW